MEGLIENTKRLRIVVAPADIRSGNLQNRSLERCHYDNLLDSVVTSRRWATAYFAVFIVYARHATSTRVTVRGEGPVK
jgi:hypothetical protein